MRALLIAIAIAITGCATTTKNIVRPCNDDALPEPPARTLQVDQDNPGEVVRATRINRKQWIAHADELTAILKGCKHVPNQ